MQATAAAVRQARSARGDKNAMEVAQTELHALSAWWSQPSAGAEVRADLLGSAPLLRSSACKYDLQKYAATHLPSAGCGYLLDIGRM